MSELEKYIQGYFGIVDTSEIEVITSLFSFHEIKKNQFLQKQGRPCTEMHFVQSGYLRMFNQFKNKEVTQWISSKGFFATDLSGFIYNTPSRFDIQALDNTAVYSISQKDYNSISNHVSTWTKLEKLFIVRCFIMLEERVYSHLSLTSEERYNVFFENHPEYFIHIPLQYIASMLGMTPETLSRIRKKHALSS